MEYNDHLSDIEQWSNMWDELQGHMDDGSSPPEPEVRVNPKPIATSQDTYWDYLNQQMTEPEEDGLLQERNVPNPVYPDSVGPDNEIDAAWVNDNLLSEIESMKQKLYDLESKLSGKMGGEQKWVEKAHTPELGKLQSEIDALKKRIDSVSNSLGIKDEPSPWRVDD